MNLIALYSRVIDRIDNIIRISELRNTQARNMDVAGFVNQIGMTESVSRTPVT